ncbi:2-(1,2-epoxy-1,2-dihydrophenyl)acetyl-CoA isomerase [Nocardioides ginsengisegetis]|uniref:2-(1,2-epoxy-1,2-dihydrophenyl)acetyl-CoA isomerase n=1 Tax=Nocardioides ginsengisegetis TaxID=661491 RepID=A0A7W3P9A2_9ACTN|nr:enoyl-CoA hydratase-related protein [Nocardioides ginsengisegetis]MBA8803249.1 2-(1,2-epoxy-1,2-dihydrophenyl)acetyl-CoA isomerase [Nocardioides ginsengisegetis]
MQESPVVVDIAGAVATVVINRPAQRNALDRLTKEALRDELSRVAADATVRAVVLTGAGLAFCVGQDLAEHAEALKTDPATAFETIGQHYAPIVTALAAMEKPVIAAVNGTCVGAGLALALACDLRVLSAEAMMSTAFTGIGLTCDSGLASTLARSVGESRAKELILLAEPFSADDAVQWGIAGRVVPAEEVGDVARALAQRLAVGPTIAYAETKHLIAQSFNETIAETLQSEAAAQARVGQSKDHRNGVAAFLAKRKPVFEGR